MSTNTSCNRITFDHSRIQSRQNGWPQTCGKPIHCPLNLSRQIGQLAELPELESDSELSDSETSDSEED